MKIEVGMVIKTPGMILRVDKITGAYCQTSYKKGSEWFRRAVSENRKRLAKGIEEGRYSVLCAECNNI